MRQRTAGGIVAFCCLPLALALAGFVPGAVPARPVPLPDAPAPITTPVKLGFGDLTTDQYKDLWKRTDNYALAEAFLKQCGQPSNVERKMIQAAAPCIEPAALKKVATYFRNKVVELGRKNQFDGSTDHAQGLVKSTRVKIDNAVGEVRSMCQSCFIC